MSIEEKLQHFYDTVVTETQKEADETISQHRQQLKEELEEHKKQKLQESEEVLKTETEQAHREMNRALSTEHLSLKRNWNKEQNHLKEELFLKVKGRLKDFMATPEYEEYLCKKIREAKAFAGEDEIRIYLSSSDASRAAALSAKTGLELEVSEDDFLGGIQAVIPSKNILIDNSFLEAYHNQKEDFSFEGGH